MVKVSNELGDDFYANDVASLLHEFVVARVRHCSDTACFVRTAQQRRSTKTTTLTTIDHDFCTSMLSALVSESLLLVNTFCSLFESVAIANLCEPDPLIKMPHSAEYAIKGILLIHKSPKGRHNARPIFE